MTAHYQAPGPIARAGNAVVRWLAEVGVSIAGTRVLRVRGRKTGRQRAVVINLLTVDGVDYVVSPRGDTQWARNVRAAGAVQVGPFWARRETRASEVADAAKPDLLRSYLARWYWQVKDLKSGVLGLTPASGDEEILAAAPLIPVFALAEARAS